MHFSVWALYPRGNLGPVLATNEESHHITFLRYLIETTGRAAFFGMVYKALTNPNAFGCVKKICKQRVCLFSWWCKKTKICINNSLVKCTTLSKNGVRVPSQQGIGTYGTTSITGQVRHGDVQFSEASCWVLSWRFINSGFLFINSKAYYIWKSLKYKH